LSACRAAQYGAPIAFCDLMRALAELGCGRVESGIAFAERAARVTTGAQRVEADHALCEGLFLANRAEELGRVLDSNPELSSEPRGQLLRARLDRRNGRTAAAEAGLRAAFRSGAHVMLRRTAGFELAKLLDALGRYDEAFDIAAESHASTGLPFDTGRMVSEIERCASFARRGGFRMRSAPTRRVERTALICSLPRSGTTLLEQMLDRHPSLTGLGELPAVETLARGITTVGGWPEGVWMADTATLDRLQAEYIAFVRRLSQAPSNATTLDKTLDTWRRLPAIAAALPGAKLIRIKRDPRDMAISIFLSNFHRESMGWNASLPDIRRVIEAERRSVPELARILGVELLEIDYASLVDDPRLQLARALDFLGLAWNEACLSPEGNRRLVITLSHEQVRRPVNRESIGRWKHYADRFDATWSALAKI